jgi:hypothetical protein
VPTAAPRHRPATERFPLSRRRALGGLVVGAAALTSGCGLIGAGPAVSAIDADPLEPLVNEKQALFDQYAATIAAYSGLANRLGPLRDAHRQHRDALLELLDARRRAALARATPPVPGPTSGGVGDSADSAAGALLVLRGAERAAAASTRAACLEVTDPPAQGDVGGVSARVVVLGSIAAAEASHQVALS